MSNPTCYLHPNAIATTTCDKCHRPICAADHRRYTKGAGMYAKQKMFCPTCYDQAKAGDKRWNIIGLVLATIIFIAIGALFYYIINSGQL